MEKISLSKILPAILVIVASMIVVSGSFGGQAAFAEEEQELVILVSDKLKKDPFAMKIIAEMEAQKLRYKQISEGKIPAPKVPEVRLTNEQIEVEKNRKIANDSLQADLKSMEKKYLDFTPRNAYQKFVSKLNETYHAIFWDQFDYLNAKVQLAIAAKNLVLENGGSFYEAQREYYKYASMPRLDMISYIEELNIKHGFANEEIQSNFDAKGKLPRFEEDKDAPCYGCDNVDDSSSKSNDDSTITKVSNNVKIDPKSEIKILQEQLSELRQKFLDTNDLEKKKSLVNSLNDTVKKIQDLTY